MSYAEFQIRLFAYKRVQLREWEKVRILAWYAMKGPHMNPKNMPKSLNQFIKLDIDNGHATRVTEAQKARFLEAMEDYIKQTQK
jgi:hypothetical protein